MKKFICLLFAFSLSTWAGFGGSRGGGGFSGGRSFSSGRSSSFSARSTTIRSTSSFGGSRSSRGPVTITRPAPPSPTRVYRSTVVREVPVYQPQSHFWQNMLLYHAVFGHQNQPIVVAPQASPGGQAAPVIVQQETHPIWDFLANLMLGIVLGILTYLLIIGIRDAVRKIKW